MSSCTKQGEEKLEAQTWYEQGRTQGGFKLISTTPSAVHLVKVSIYLQTKQLPIDAPLMSRLLVSTTLA